MRAAEIQFQTVATGVLGSLHHLVRGQSLADLDATVLEAIAGIDGAVMIATRTLIEYGKALAAAGENYKPPMIYSLKGE